MFISTFPFAPVTDAKFSLESEHTQVDVVDPAEDVQGEEQPEVNEKVDESLSVEGKSR